jgi:hypothetical protein
MSIFWWARRGAGSGGGGDPPDTPSISISGTTLTVSGGSSDATHTAYYADFNASGGSGDTWTSIGSRTGNGTITLSTPTAAGAYLIQVLAVKNSQTARSEAVYYEIRGSTTAVWYRVTLAVQSVIQGMNLVLPDASTLPSARVYCRKLLTDRNTTAPFVMVALGGLEATEDYTNERDRYGYPVTVAIAVPSNQDFALDTDDEEYLRMREHILRRFREQRLSTVGEVTHCKVEPLPVLDPELWKSNLWVQGFTLRFFAPLTRGSV